MDKKLSQEMFLSIYENSLPNIVHQTQKKAFDKCVKNYDLPFLDESETECLENYTKLYMKSIDLTLLYFAKKIIE